VANTRGIRAGRAFVELGVNDRLTRGLRRAQRQLRAFGQSVRGIGARLAAVSGAVAAGFGLSTRVFAGFDDRMRVVRAVTGATQEQFEALTDEAKRLGRTTSFTAGQVAEAMTELGRAGFDPTAILQSTEAVLALARATSTDLPRATEIAGAALRGFNLPASEMGRVSDVLTATANKSAQTLEDLFEAFKPVAPIAAEAGESMEDVAAAIGILANNGIKGSLAGNALARAYKNLSSSAAQDELRRFGVEAVDASGNLRPLADIINDLAKATQGLGTAERLSIFETLFGRGQAAALKLASSGTAFDTLRDEIREAAGIAVETAEQMDAGIGGAFRKLLSAVEGVAIAIGEAIEGPVRKVADVLARVAGYITQAVNRNRELVTSIAKITAIVLGVGIALIIAGTAIVGVGAVLGSLAAIASAAGTAIGVIGTVLGALGSPVGLVIAGVAALGTAILYYTGAGGEAIAWLSERFGELRAFVGKVAGGIADALAAGDIQLAAQILWLGLQVAWKRGVAALNEVWLGARNFFITTAQKMWYGALAVAQTVFNALEIAWIETTAFLSKTWTRFTSGFQKVWQSASSFVAKRMLEIQGLFDSGLDVEAAKRAVDEQLDAKLVEIDANTQRDLSGRESRRQRERGNAADLNEATLAEIGRRFEEAQGALRSGTNADIAETQRKLDVAQAKLDEAIAEARRRREEQDQSGGEPAGNVPRDLIGRLQEGLAGLGAAIERGVAVRGTFNALAVQSLAVGDDAAERTAKATEQTAKDTRRLADSAQSGGLSFT